MNNRKKAELAMLERVVQFEEDHPLVPPNPLATQHFAEVAAAKTAMQVKGGVKDQGRGAFRAAAQERRGLAKDLRAKMREIAETAKVLSKSIMPGIEQQFRMPNQTYQDLRDRAQAFVTAVEPIKQAFIDRDSAATFVEDLEAAIEAFDVATGGRNAGLGSQIGATAGLTATARAGIAAVRALNAILIKRYRSNPDLLAEWTAAQRIAGWPSQAATTPPTIPGTPVAPGS